MTTRFYFWHEIDKEVIGYKEGMTMPFFNRECIDAVYDDPFQRYGKFVEDGIESSWEHIPKEKFNKEFLINLHLMGID